MEKFNPFSLEGKRILVTGASSGIGRQIAIDCSRMGAEVYLTGRNQERLEETLSQIEKGKGISISADLSDSTDLEILVEALPELDGVVHCAGVIDRTLAKNVKEKDLQRVMKVNFEAPVLLQKLLLKKRKVKNSGSIVFMSSIAYVSPNPGQCLYAASKGALVSYAKVLSLELANIQVRVNCICPAMVATDVVRKDFDLLGVDIHQDELNYPLKRHGKPEDVSNLAIYLLSDASAWMTGNAIKITGGL